MTAGRMWSMGAGTRPARWTGEMGSRLWGNKLKRNKMHVFPSEIEGLDLFY